MICGFVLNIQYQYKFVDIGHRQHVHDVVFLILVQFLQLGAKKKLKINKTQIKLQ